MRILGLFVCLFLLILGGCFLLKPHPQSSQHKSSQSVESVASDSSVSPKKEYLFVPYWAVDQDISTNADSLIYFGVTADTNGIVTSEPGYKNLPVFEKYKNSASPFLAVRLLNTDTNAEILKSTTIQEKIAADALTLAKHNNFLGIVLDLETQGLPFDSLVHSITEFNTLFAKQAHAQNLLFAPVFYGDTFYRARPFDVSQIAKSADLVFVMAYDMSKAKGDPGPNFPLTGQETYGYDFETMVLDFTHAVSRQKLVILFGMFGYDWNVDSDNKGIGMATSKTTLQFEKMMTQCISSNTCKSVSDPYRGTEITYKDQDGNHVVWFEDYESVKKKKEYLASKELFSTGYFAYSYY